MFFLVFGSSGAGKTFVLNRLRGRVSGLAIHDFDEVGVPPDADLRWRHRANEEWVRRALAHQARGTDLLLAGQTPLGELLAAPSAPELEAVSACLMDCDDETRRRRLDARGREWLDRVPGDLQDYFNWAAWLRGHAADPQWLPHVIRREESEPTMRWSRWSGWSAGDPHWRVRVVDTTALPVDDVAAELVAWIAEERALLRTGTHPLTGSALAQADAAGGRADGGSRR